MVIKNMKRKCKFEIGLNKPGMIMFNCLVHGDSESSDNTFFPTRIKEQCVKELSKELDKIFKFTRNKK